MGIKLFKSKMDKRRDEFTSLVGEFANSNPKYKNSFILIADPETNVVVGAYRGIIGAFQNKSKTRTLKDLFKYDSNEDQAKGNKSKRNLAIYQLLSELDGMLDSFAKKAYDLKQGEKDLRYLEKKGFLKVGSQKVNEKGNTQEVAVV